MRRLVTFVVVTAVTAVSALWWLHDGDLAAAVEPVVAEWDADLLARDAGIVEPATPAAPVQATDAPDAGQPASAEVEQTAP